MSDTSLFESDEEIYIAQRVEADENDIIAETPQKIKKKKIHTKNKLIKVVDTKATTSLEMCQFTEINRYTLNEFCVTRNYSNVANANKYEFLNLNAKYKQPYIFFDIKDILNFTEFFRPVNGNIKTVGIYKQGNFSMHSLVENRISLKHHTPLNILLDLKLLNLFPINNTAIEVYGFIAFQNKLSRYLPVFVVEFWTTLINDFKKYVKLLRMQKLYVPSCYKSTVECENNDFTNLKDADYTFEEADESCLNKETEHIEQIFTEFDQIMSIQEDVFQ